MDLQIIKNKIREKMPLAILRRKNMRKGVVNDSPTLLCPNCMGGHIFHDLGFQFKSPTVNLSLTQTDFVKFVLNLDDYLNGEINFIHNGQKLKYPRATISYDGGTPIIVNFTHYDNEKVALEKWNSRAKRIDKSNMFICLSERDGITKQEILSIGNLDVKGILVFTSSDYSDIPYCLRVPKYIEAGEVGNILKSSWIDDHREYEEFFDFVKWFNEAEGKPYDVKRFSKIEG